MKLSILICSLPKRRESLNKLLTNLRSQGDYTANSVTKSTAYYIERIVSNDVEILICTDNKRMTVGAKRNLLIKESIGDYFVFVDDDDRVTDDYTSRLLSGIKTDKDVILFDVEISINGGKYRKVYYDANYIGDRNLPNSYLRIPNHIMCWKRSVPKKKFPNISMGEDIGWATQNKHYIKSQAKVDKTLYYYDFNNETTETQ